MNDPYGGKLISKILENSQRNDYDQILKIDLDHERDIVNIAHGAYSPLTGFMNSDDFNSVVEDSKLSNGLTWTIPIYISISKKKANDFKIGSKILLKGKNVEAILSLEDKFSYSKEKFNKNVFDTNDLAHPGSIHSFSEDEVFLGGEISLIEHKNHEHKSFNLAPQETRDMFKKKGWNSIVAFQTRNPPHLSHEFIQKIALEFVDGLLIHPIIGKKKEGDFSDDVILKVYDRIINKFYPPNSTMLSIFPSKMHYAGPREAVFHAIVRKNYGCTHFIVGRNHAGVGDYYHELAAHEIFDQIEDLGIEILKFSNAFYSPAMRMFTTQKVAPDIAHKDKVSPSGTEVRKLIKAKRMEELLQFMRQETIDTILEFEKPFV